VHRGPYLRGRARVAQENVVQPVEQTDADAFSRTRGGPQRPSSRRTRLLLPPGDAKPSDLVLDNGDFDGARAAPRISGA